MYYGLSQPSLKSVLIYVQKYMREKSFIILYVEDSDPAPLGPEGKKRVV